MKVEVTCLGNTATRMETDSWTHPEGVCPGGPETAAPTWHRAWLGSGGFDRGPDLDHGRLVVPGRNPAREEEVKGGQIDSARARLQRLARLRLGGAELDYWLGACEEAEGHIDAALAAWARIPVGSSRFADAALDRARLAIKEGRFALAEDVLEHTAFPHRSSSIELSKNLWQQVYLFTGRYDELRRSIEDEWAGGRHRAEVLRKHWLVDDARSFPVDAVRTRLDETGRTAPEDDRVWLGRAYLAIRAAQFGEADAWLKKCHAARPHDPVVWRARLEWATGSDRLGEAIEAMRHLPADGLLPEQLMSLRAWLAARLGDEGSEQAALTSWLNRVPCDTQAVARLIELAARAGRTEQVAQLRRRKAELDQTTEEYRRLLGLGDPEWRIREVGPARRSPGPMVRGSGLVGAGRTRFEARGLGTSRAGPDRADRAGFGVELERSRGRCRAGPVPAPWLSPRQGEGNEGQSDGLFRSPSGRQPHTVAVALADLIPVESRDRIGALPAGTVPIFRDDAHVAGLHFAYDNDPTPMCRLPETMMGGVGLLDYDGDGWLDVYAVQGGTLSDEAPPPRSAQRDRLFRNRGDGTFEDVTSSSGACGVSWRLRPRRGRG